MNSLFKLGGSLDSRTRLILEILGFLLLILIWYVLRMASPKPVEATLFTQEEVGHLSKYIKDGELNEEGLEWIATQRGD